MATQNTPTTEQIAQAQAILAAAEEARRNAEEEEKKERLKKINDQIKMDNDRAALAAAPAWREPLLLLVEEIEKQGLTFSVSEDSLLVQGTISIGTTYLCEMTICPEIYYEHSARMNGRLRLRFPGRYSIKFSQFSWKIWPRRQDSKTMQVKSALKKIKELREEIENIKKAQAARRSSAERLSEVLDPMLDELLGTLPTGWKVWHSDRRLNATVQHETMNFSRTAFTIYLKGAVVVKMDANANHLHPVDLPVMMNVVQWCEKAIEKINHIN